MKTFELTLTKEEMNVIRNGLNLILTSHKHDLSSTSLEWYKKVKRKFDEKYESQ